MIAAAVRGSTPSTSGHTKRNPLAGCKCDYCMWKRLRVNARSRARLNRPKPKSPAPSGHAKILKAGCCCNYCEWRRERNRSRARGRPEKRSAEGRTTRRLRQRAHYAKNREVVKAKQAARRAADDQRVSRLAPGAKAIIGNYCKGVDA